MNTAYALVDCNSFYASCEQVFRPDLVGKPVVVMSNNDGCVIARSKEAKQVGVKMGEPVFKRKAFLKEHHVHIFSANFAMYGDISSRVMETLRLFAHHMEIYSIDESFLVLTTTESLSGYGRRIKRTVEAWTKIPVSIGIGPTKTLAKLANHLAKKEAKYHGVCDLTTDIAAQKAVNNLDVADIWGVGRRYAHMLYRHDIFTIGDFKTIAQDWIKQKMTVQGQRTWRELHGEPCITLEEIAPTKKGICTSRSFGRPLRQIADISEALSTFTAIAAQKLRKEQQMATRLTVFVQTDQFKLWEKQHHESMSIQLPMPTDSTITLIQYACFLLKKLYRKGYVYKKTGIFLAEFVPRNGLQLALFDHVNHEKQAKLMAAYDSIIEQYGNVLFIASEGTKRRFKMRQNALSPRYTLRLEDIPIILAE